MASSVFARENIKNWTETSHKLYLFRRGLEEMQKISESSITDERGYQWVAGVHGGFGGQPYCQHGNLNFVTWHRPYVLDFELKLRDQIRKIASAAEADEWRLPYWDWAAEDVTGLPESFTVATYVDQETSETKPNPLLSQPYQLEWNPGLVGAPSPPPPWPINTYRNPGSLEQLQILRPRVENALKESSFNTFSLLLEQPHNGLHIWVKGYMATFRSSFDPIFWVHHANVDRQFWLWQRKFSNSSIPSEVKDFPCQPFKFKDIKANAFFEVEQLGYTYAESQNVITRTTAVEAMNLRFTAARASEMAERLETPIVGAVEAPIPPVAPQTLEIEINAIGNDFERAYLRLYDLEHTEKTYEIRVFANREETPDATTPLTDEQHYLGLLVLLGHGNCPGAPGHCDRKATTADGLRQEHHLSPGLALLDVTKGLMSLKENRTLANGKVGEENLSLSLVVVDLLNQQVSHEQIQFARLSLSTV
jgi:tyrosinase